MALDGYPIGTYYASEVDPHAIKQSQHSFPDTIHLGDVRGIDVRELEPIDLLLGGSPCQNFSFSGKRRGMSSKCSIEILTLEKYLELKESGFEFEGQSYLFWEYVRVLNDIRQYNPDVLFLLENVEMTKKWERVLSEGIGIFGVHINAALVSAQNRKRIYWSNIRTKRVGLFGELHTDIPQPEDRGILLRDILEGEVDEKYYLSDRAVARLLNYTERQREKGNGFTSKFHSGGEKMSTLKVGRGGGGGRESSIKSGGDKASALLAGQHKLPRGMDLIRCAASRGRGKGNEQRLEPRSDGKTNTLTSVSKDNLIVQGCIKFGRTEEAKAKRRESMRQGKDHTPFTEKEISGLDTQKMSTLTCATSKDNLIMQLNPSLESGGKQPYQQNRIYDPDGITPALCANKADLLVCHNLQPRTGKGPGGKGPLSRTDGKSYCLDTSAGMGVETPYRQDAPTPDTKEKYPSLRSNPGGKLRGIGLQEMEKSNTVTPDEYLSTGKRKRGEDGRSVLTSQHERRIRRLTVRECCLLQTVPEEFHEWVVSDTQAYKMLGNGWCVEVIKHIFSFLPWERKAMSLGE